MSLSPIPPRLPQRSKGVKPPLPAKPSNDTHVSVAPTMPVRVISNTPVLPPRLPSRPPVLPSRQKTASRICTRRKPAKYETRDFTVVDEYVRQVPEYATTQELADALTCHFTDPIDRARAIFDWCAYNVTYDWLAFQSGNHPAQDAQTVLRTKKGVCAGYANLFQSLAERIGLQSRVVHGYGKGIGYDPAQKQVKGSNHAWNVVRVDEEWRMIESTWGAGYINNNQFIRAFQPLQFLVDPEEFVYSHMPLDDTLQFTVHKYSWEEFFALNLLPPLFWRSGAVLRNYVDVSSCITVSGEGKLLLSVPTTCQLMSSLDEKRSHCVLSRNNDTFDVEVLFRPRNGTSTLQVFAKLREGEATFAQLLNYTIIATDCTDLPLFPTVYGVIDGLHVKAPLYAPLIARTTVEFIVDDLSDAPGNHEIVLWVNGQFSPFRRQGTRYSLTKHIVDTTVKIMRKKGSQYAVLAIWD